MAQFPYTEMMDILEPDVSQLITEDDEPVDNIPSAKQQRLLVESLYSAQPFNRPFLADANVAVYGALRQPPIVPDMFLSLDVELAEDWWLKKNRSYFIWEFGKPPDVVVEIVSNNEGDEAGKKLHIYARIGIPYYIIYDPQHIVLESTLAVYELNGGAYLLRPDDHLPRIGLGVILWQGVYENKEDIWLRWCDEDGELIANGAELAEQERARAEQERARAEQERARAERLAARLRELGVDPDVV